MWLAGSSTGSGLGFLEVRRARRNTRDSLAGTLCCDGALIAFHANILVDLQEQRAIAKLRAAFDALAATNALVTVDGVLEIGVFDEFTFDGGRGAELILGRRRKLIWLGLEEPRTQIAIPAHHKGVEALRR